MNMGQPRAHWKRLFEVPALPGWALLGWKLASALSTFDFLKNNWYFLISPTGNILLIFAGVLWLLAVVLWPARKSEHSNSSLLIGLPVGSDIKALVKAEEETRGQAIESLHKQMYDNIKRIDQSIRDLIPKPQPPLKDRTKQLADDLFSLLKQLGPEPAHPLSNKRGTETEQKQTFDNYYQWQRDAYYQYMAYFKDRVVKTDYELAACRIFTKLDEKEIDPPRNSGEIELKKIAQTLLLVASQMPD